MVILPVEAKLSHCNLGECLQLIPTEAESCISYRGSVTGKVIGPSDSLEIIDFIAKQTELGAVDAGAPFRSAFLGIHVDEGVAGGGNGQAGRDNLSSAINVPQIFQQEDDGRLTSVGVLFVAGLCCAFVGVIMVAFRRRRYRRQEEFDYENEIRATSSSGEQAVDGDRQQRMDLLGGNVDVQSSDDVRLSFDLADNMKSEMLNIHGSPLQIRTVVLVDEHSDSDVDSWAQTDATLGSLEVRLEEITAEV